MLLIKDNRYFVGEVGYKTTTKLHGETICIGDVVRVAAGSKHNECVGVVAFFGNMISVMGLATTPLSELNIVEIVTTHKDLTVGSKLEHDQFRVWELTQ